MSARPGTYTRLKRSSTVRSSSARTSSRKSQTLRWSSARCWRSRPNVKTTSPAAKRAPSDHRAARSEKRSERWSSDQAYPVASHGTYLLVTVLNTSSGS
jgi:hypothetical protein